MYVKARPARALIFACLAAGMIGMSGCNSTVDDDPADNIEVADVPDEDTDDLDTVVACAVTLEAVAQLPKAETQTDVVDETPSDDEAPEHAGLAQSYRQRAAEIVGASPKASADLAKRFKAAADKIEQERRSESAADFAASIGEDADSCPAL